jgi:hypothetical protein
LAVGNTARQLCRDAVPTLPKAERQGSKGNRMIGWGHFRVSGLSSRVPGSGVQVRVQVQDLNVAPHPHLYLIART